MKEVWKEIFDGNYEVSNLGQIRRARPWVSRWGTPSNGGRTWVGKLVAQRKNDDGYWTVALFVNGKNKHCLVHCLVAAAFLGPKPKGKEVNHKDFDRSNAQISNLEYLTRLKIWPIHL